MTTYAWLSGDGDFIGVIGANSLAEMAEAIRSQENGFLLEHIEDNENIPDLEAWLEVNARVMAVHSDHFEDEGWDGSWVTILPSIASEVPKDHVFVLGVNL